MRFEFATASRIIFGLGSLRGIGPLAKELGAQALVVTGRDSRRAQPLAELLREAGVDSICFPVQGEPDLETVRQGTAMARGERCDLVLGFGGGSALDAGKAIAAMLANPGGLLNYLEIIGEGKALTKPSAPFIAIPTTAGTGSEVTRNAVLASPEHGVKVSLRSPLMLPRIALVDPELTYALPASLTASTGLDALTQLIEPFVCSRANPMTDAFCREGIRAASRSLRVAFENGTNHEARENMCLASLLGGLALANAGLGAVHGLAGPFGGRFGAPHGAVVAALLPHVMQTNLRALRQRQPGNEALHRYEEVARLLTGKATATAEDGVEWVSQLVSDLKIPPLRVYGFAHEHIPELVENAGKASSMKANPVVLTQTELAEILDRAF